MNVEYAIKLTLAGLVSEGVLTPEQGDILFKRMSAVFSGQLLSAYDSFSVSELAVLITGAGEETA